MTADSVDDKQRAIQAVENQLAELFGAEVRKVDGIRAVWSHLEMVAEAAGDEAKRQADRKRMALAQLDRLKQGVQFVMEGMPWREGKPRKIEGEKGALYLKADGGKQAVEVTDESLVPDEFCFVSVKIPALVWRAIAEAYADTGFVAECGPRVPSLTAIASALEQPCEECEGIGFSNQPKLSAPGGCPACGGSGKAGVPGARLAPRGQHVECK